MWYLKSHIETKLFSLKLGTNLSRKSQQHLRARYFRSANLFYSKALDRQWIFCPPRRPRTICGTNQFFWFNGMRSSSGHCSLSCPPEPPGTRGILLAGHLSYVCIVVRDSIIYRCSKIIWFVRSSVCPAKAKGCNKLTSANICRVFPKFVPSFKFLVIYPNFQYHPVKVSYRNLNTT